MLNFLLHCSGAPRTLGAPGLCPPLSIGCDATVIDGSHGSVCVLWDTVIKNVLTYLLTLITMFYHDIDF